eukprot:Nk52_evm4s256 gene=Nk52_evmTU4s256
MLNQNVDPEDIVLVTFTNQAADEMKSRLGEYLAEASVYNKSHRVRVSTIHGLMNRCFREEIKALMKFPEDVDYKLSPKLNKKLEKFVKDARNRHPHFVNNIKPIFDMVSARFSGFGINYELRNLEEKCAKAFKKGFMQYCKYCAQEGAVQFDDLELLGLCTLREQGLSRGLLKDIKYVMVDEFQDLTKIQYEICEHLSVKNGRHLCVVGDPNQSIYGFRDALPGIFERFKRDYDPRVLVLRENFRSNGHIVEFSNELLRKNQLNMSSGIDISQTAVREKRISPLYMKHDSDLGKRYVDGHTSIIGEVENIAFCIQKWTECGGKLNDVAIMARTTTNIWKTLQQVLKRKRIPFKIDRGVNLLGNKEVKKVFAYLIVALDDTDTEKFADLVKHSSDKKAKKWIKDAKVTCYKMAKEFLWRKEEKKSLEDFELFVLLEDLNKLMYKEHAPMTVVLHKLATTIYPDSYEKKGNEMVLKLVQNPYEEEVDESELEAETPAERRKEKTKKKHLKTVSALVHGLMTYWDRWILDYDSPGWRDVLLTFLHPQQDKSGIEDENGVYPQEYEEYVTMTSIHQTKGREYGFVMILGAEDGILPDFRSNGQGVESQREELRCLYVACTRAKDILLVSVIGTRHDFVRYGNPVRYRAPSKFLFKDTSSPEDSYFNHYSSLIEYDPIFNPPLLESSNHRAFERRLRQYPLTPVDVSRRNPQTPHRTTRAPSGLMTPPMSNSRSRKRDDGGEIEEPGTNPSSGKSKLRRKLF